MFIRMSKTGKNYSGYKLFLQNVLLWIYAHNKGVLDVNFMLMIIPL